MSDINFEDLGRLLLPRAESLCFEWLPGGKVSGDEYECANLNGGKGKSLKVNVASGKWADFADSSVRGGDLISLFAAIKGISQKESFDQLKDRQSGYNNKPTSTRKANIDDIGPVPQGVQRPSFVHYELGKAALTWGYFDEREKPLFYISRYNLPNGKKEFRPWSWSKKKQKFVHKQWPTPRPLYRLNLLAKYPSRPVLLCEGEKATVAAQEIVGDAYVCTCWPGGVNGWEKADWEPLRKRPVLVWPDNDVPGMKACFAIADHLSTIASDVKIIRHKNPEKTHGTDAADFTGTLGDFRVWSEPLIQGITPARELSPLAERPSFKDVQPMPKSINMIYTQAGLQPLFNKAGKPPANEHTVASVIRTHDSLKGKFWYDEFHNEYFSSWAGPARPIDDSVFFNMLMFFQGPLELTTLKLGVVKTAILAQAKNDIRNEPRDKLSRVEWDGNSRISQFFNVCMGVPMDEYSFQASENFWKSMAARILTPGAKVDTMVIFEGNQGIGKSQALEAIVGKKYFASLNFDARNKDFVLGIQGKLLVELGELSGFSRSDINAMKAFLSNPVDRIRKPFGSKPEDLPRSVILCGTTNDNDYLNDPTGARRYVPVICGKINLDLIKRERLQLFAEAIHRVKEGEDWWTMPEHLAERETSRRTSDDPWLTYAVSFLSELESRNPGIVEYPIRFQTKDFLLNKLQLTPDRQEVKHSLRAGKALRKAGAEYKAVKENGRTAKRWEYFGQEADQQEFQEDEEHL